jgi:protein-tyrosine phosphatase
MMRALYGYCSPECRTAAEIQALNFGGNDYNFITDDGDLVDVTQHIHIDLADGECHSMGQPRDRNGQQVPSRGLEDYLDETIRFIAAHIRRGCVLVHCGAGKSRSVAVVIAYLCRYAGMSLTEALTFVSARRPGACPAPCFIEAIKRWLRLDELAMGGPRR